MNYNYTEEHYAEMYNNLPEGLKDLVLSGRLAIQVSAIGSRHGLSADQVADLEPAVEDVCLGLVLRNQLAENIKAQVGVDERVANRIAAEVEIEIFRQYEPELIISRQQKEDLDEKISTAANQAEKAAKKPAPAQAPASPTKTGPATQAVDEPQDISDHSNVKAVKDWYSKDENPKDEQGSEKKTTDVKTFDWDSLGKKEEIKKEEILTAENSKVIPENKIQTGVEEKIDKLTESINKLVDIRFGGAEKKDEGMSEQMKELMKRLEKAEAENAENRNLIKKLQGGNPVTSIFGQTTAQTNNGKILNENKVPENKIQIDKERKVEINKSEDKKETPNGNIQISTVSKNIPIEKMQSTQTDPLAEIKKPATIQTSAVTVDTLNTIVETRNSQPNNPSTLTSNKKTLSLDELIKQGDEKIKEAAPKTATLVFPGINDEKKIDIKNQTQSSSLRQTLLDDIEFLKNKAAEAQKAAAPEASKTDTVETSTKPTPTIVSTSAANFSASVMANTTTENTNPFKDELLPKTKEDRMKSLQDKIKAMNVSVSSGGKTNIAASGLDPYKI